MIAGTTATGWEAIGGERSGDAWRYPERNAQGETIGTITRPDVPPRFREGTALRYKSAKGSKRGLITRWPLHAAAGGPLDPILVCEGASDTVTAISMGFDAVGIGMAGFATEEAAELLKGRHVVIVGDRDTAGAKSVEKLAPALQKACSSVRIAFPPEPHKDLRSWVVDGGAGRDQIADLVHSAAPATAGHGADDQRPGPVLVDLATVKPKRPEWLWPGRIAIGKLCLLAGNGGLGKSTATLDIVARLTTGRGWPDNPKRFAAGGAVILSAEDDVEDTIAPRLIAAGADLSRVRAMQAIRMRDDAGNPSKRGIDLAADLRHIRTAVESVPDCRLLIVDPVSAYLGRADDNRNAEVRGILAPLSAMAAELRVAVLCVSHLNKGSGVAIHRIVGSVAWAAAARTALAFAKDPDDEDRRLVLTVKSNIAKEAVALAYRIAPAEDNPDVGVVVWDDGPVDITADEAMGCASGPKPGTRLAEASEWLRRRLEGAGPVQSKDIIAEAENAGHRERTVWRAVEELGVVTRPSGFGKAWIWELMPFATGTKGLAETGRDWQRLADSGGPTR